MFDENGVEIASPAALEDELGLRQVAADLTRYEAPARRSFRDDLENVLGEVYAMIRAEFSAQNAALAARVVQLEAQRALKYVGPWKPNSNYLPGEFVSHSGGIWHCKAHTGTRPNRCPEAWTLAVKAGRDAK